MLEHQINNIIKRDQLQGLTHVDLSVGGDHGGRKFRMTLKILFRFHERSTISWIFQIASVSHSDDDIKILESTVLKLFLNASKLACFLFHILEGAMRI
jgi:hypothetical protein